MRDADAAPTAERFPWRPLCWLLLAALLLRCGTNLARVDELLTEGIYRGTLANAFVTGAPLWPAHLPEIPHVPGSVLMGVLAAPFYVLLGPTTFSMHMAGTLMHLAAVAMFFWLLYRRLGRRAAIWCSWLFVLAPPGLAKISILSYGDHVESLPFFLFTAIFALEWAAGVGPRGVTGSATGAPPRLVRTAFLAGLGVALSIGFHLQGTLGVAAVGATCLVLALPRLLTAAFWTEVVAGFLPGLVLGAALPLLVFAVTGTSALSLWGGNPMDHMVAENGAAQESRLAGIAEKFRDLLANGYSWCFQYENRRLADLTLLLALACTVGLLAVALRRWRRGEVSARELWLRGGFFLVYPAVFSVAYGASSGSFKISSGTSSAIEVRYALPVLPFLLLPIGLAAARLWESARRPLALAVLLPALAVGAYGSLSTCSLDAVLQEPARRGYQWEHFDGHFVYGSVDPAVRGQVPAEVTAISDRMARDVALNAWMYSKADPARFVALIREYDDTPEWTWPHRYNAPLGKAPRGGPQALGKWLEGLPAEARPFAFADTAATLAAEERFAAPQAQALLSLASNEAERRAALRGFGEGLFKLEKNGRVMLPRQYDGQRVLARVRELPKEAERGEVLFGLGFRIARMLNEWYEPGDAMVALTLAALPAELKAPFLRGLGAGYRTRFVEPPAPGLDSPAIRHLTQRMTPEMQQAFRAGLGGADSAR